MFADTISIQWFSSITWDSRTAIMTFNYWTSFSITATVTSRIWDCWKNNEKMLVNSLVYENSCIKLPYVFKCKYCKPPKLLDMLLPRAPLQPLGMQSPLQLQLQPPASARSWSPESMKVSLPNVLGSSERSYPVS